MAAENTEGDRLFEIVQGSSWAMWNDCCPLDASSSRISGRESATSAYIKVKENKMHEHSHLPTVMLLDKGFKRIYVYIQYNDIGTMLACDLIQHG